MYQHLLISPQTESPLEGNNRSPPRLEFPKDDPLAAIPSDLLLSAIGASAFPRRSSFPRRHRQVVSRETAQTHRRRKAASLLKLDSQRSCPPNFFAVIRARLLGQPGMTPDSLVTLLVSSTSTTLRAGNSFVRGLRYLRYGFCPARPAPRYGSRVLH